MLPSWGHNGRPRLDNADIIWPNALRCCASPHIIMMLPPEMRSIFYSWKLNFILHGGRSSTERNQFFDTVRTESCSTAAAGILGMQRFAKDFSHEWAHAGHACACNGRCKLDHGPDANGGETPFNDHGSAVIQSLNCKPRESGRVHVGSLASSWNKTVKRTTLTMMVLIKKG